MKEVRDRILIGQQEIDGGFMVHGLGDRLGCRFAIGSEQNLRIVFGVHNGWVQPYRNDDTEIVGFRFRDVASANRV